MTAMDPTARRPAGREERLIGALTPTPIPRPRPSPAPLPVLPPQGLPTGADDPVLDIAHLDPSGRLSARRLLAALNWRPGHRVDIDIVDAALVIRSAAAGRHAIGGRGELALPTAARRLCGIAPASLVVLAAYLPHGLVVVHPVSTVARLLSDFHARSAGAPGAG